MCQRVRPPSRCRGVCCHHQHRTRTSSTAPAAKTETFPDAAPQEHGEPITKNIYTPPANQCTNLENASLFPTPTASDVRTGKWCENDVGCDEKGASVNLNHLFGSLETIHEWVDERKASAARGDGRRRKICQRHINNTKSTPRPSLQQWKNIFTYLFPNLPKLGTGRANAQPALVEFSAMGSS